MYKIYIDTTQRYQKSITLLKIEDGVESVVDEISGDFDIVPEMQKLLDKNFVKLDEIEEVVPNVGPGSFTGIKTGVTIANVINWTNKKRPPNKLFMPEYGSEPNITPRKK